MRRLTKVAVAVVILIFAVAQLAIAGDLTALGATTQLALAGPQKILLEGFPAQLVIGQPHTYYVKLNAPPLAPLSTLRLRQLKLPSTRERLPSQPTTTMFRNL